MIYRLAMDYDFVVYSFIILIVKYNAAKLSTTENHHDIFSSFSSSQRHQAVQITVEVNKPLELRLQNISISSACCNDFYCRASKLETQIVGNSIIYVKNITHNMSTVWNCTVEESFIKKSMSLQPTYYFIYINLHVRGAKSVFISVNDKELSFSKVDLSVYDGTAVYLYEDGEHVQIVCRNLQRTGTVHLEYFTKGNETNASNVSESATFGIQLHSGSNHSYIDCVCSTTEPNDTYVYRLTFVSNKPLFGSNESDTLSDKNSKPSPLIIGGSIGAVLVVLAITGAACCFRRTRNAKSHIESPYRDLTKQNNSSTSPTNRCDNQYDVCYNDCLSNKETYNDTPVSVKDLDPEEHLYTEIDYPRCKSNIGNTQTRNSRVYDEPYAHITVRDVTLM